MFINSQFNGRPMWMKTF